MFLDMSLLLKHHLSPSKGFDPTTDTPIEILHTILLGIVKYAWHPTHTSWNSTQKQQYALRLQATNTDGLNIHAIRANYIMQYTNSLIGRQFKTVIQTAVFHVYDLVGPFEFRIWKSVCDLAALVWFPEIFNLTEYIVCGFICYPMSHCMILTMMQGDLKIAVGNVLDVFSEQDPSKITKKIKLHLLNHMDEDVKCFGPLVGVCMEVFECFNGIFRQCSILSNHISPSRDIAYQLADQEGFKQHVTSGWWHDNNLG